MHMLDHLAQQTEIVPQLTLKARPTFLDGKEAIDV